MLIHHVYLSILFLKLDYFTWESLMLMIGAFIFCNNSTHHSQTINHCVFIFLTTFHSRVYECQYVIFDTLICDFSSHSMYFLIIFHVPCIWTRILYNTLYVSIFNMKRIIVAISDSDKHFETAIQEYIKRLGKQCTIYNLKPCATILKDTHTILSYIKRYSEYQIIILSLQGTDISSTWFAKLIDQPTLFVIWWAHWLDESLLMRESQKVRYIRLWAHTMPHGLAKLVLIEQIYRSLMISWWRKYHY